MLPRLNCYFLSACTQSAPLSLSLSLSLSRFMSAPFPAAAAASSAGSAAAAAASSVAAAASSQHPSDASTSHHHLLHSHASRPLPSIPASATPPLSAVAPQQHPHSHSGVVEPACQQGPSVSPPASNSLVVPSDDHVRLEAVQASVQASLSASSSHSAHARLEAAQAALPSNNEFGMPSAGVRDVHGEIVPTTLANAPRESN